MFMYIYCTTYYGIRSLPCPCSQVILTSTVFAIPSRAASRPSSLSLALTEVLVVPISMSSPRAPEKKFCLLPEAS